MEDANNSTSTKHDDEPFICQRSSGMLSLSKFYKNHSLNIEDGSIVATYWDLNKNETNFHLYQKHEYCLNHTEVKKTLSTLQGFVFVHIEIPCKVLLLAFLDPVLFETRRQ